MKKEIFRFFGRDRNIVTKDKKETTVANSDENEDEIIDTTPSFNLDSFFDDVDEEEEPNRNENAKPNLLLTLRDDSNESISTISSKITAETFAVGATLTSGVFSALSSIVGSCGIFCSHTLGSLAQSSSIGLSGSLGLGGLDMPNFNIDSYGNFKIDDSIDSLSNATGVSKKDLMAGRYSTDDILSIFFNSFGQGISMIFCFGIIDELFNSIFDVFLSNNTNEQ